MNKSTKIILTSAVAIGALAIGIVMLKRRLQGRSKSYTIKRSGTSIITVPDTRFNKNDVIIVYGGLHYATPQWMYDQLKASKANDLLNDNIFVFVPYNIHSASLHQLTQEALANKVAGDFSMIGFSKGGEKVVSNKSSRQWKFVGLIDPAIGWSYASPTWGKESVLTYGSSAMMNIYENNGGRYTKLADLIKSGGGIAVKSVNKHEDAPKEFFETYEKRIQRGA